MKVMKVDPINRNMKVIKIARTINDTKTLPSNMTKESVNKLLATKSLKLTGGTLLGIVGMPVSLNIFANTFQSPSLFVGLSPIVLFMTSGILAWFKSMNNREVEKAYGIINDGKDVADEYLKYIKEGINNIRNKHKIGK